MARAKSTSAERRLPDRCDDCGRFVGNYPVGFYADLYCADCYDARHPEVGTYGVVLPGTEAVR